MRLRDRLAELRRESGLTLRELRDRIEQHTGDRLSISYLSELERADTTPPLDTLARIAQGYDISLRDLLGPVDVLESRTNAQYPAALRSLLETGEIDDEWAATLARIEFRGQRPRTEDEWRAIHAMLRAFIGTSKKE